MPLKKKTPPPVHLSYSKGELVVKEGEYGISVYKITKGHVRVFKKSNNTIIPLATLGKGEVFGEMTFFNFLVEPRSASVEALDDVELEVWNTIGLTEEYKNMPLMLRYIIQQTLSRLLRMNRIIYELSKKKKHTQEQKSDEEKKKERRRYFRKQFEQECSYRPAIHSKILPMNGFIKDISPIGIGVEVSAKNTLNVSHELNTQMIVSFHLPTGSKINEAVILKSVRKSKVPGHLILGFEFSNISKDGHKQIGFFMMP